MHMSDADGATNGAALALLDERVEALEGRTSELGSLRRDLDRTYRVVLEIQAEMRNNQRLLMDKLDKLEGRRD